MAVSRQMRGTRGPVGAVATDALYKKTDVT
jgi:hypothetical protein